MVEVILFSPPLSDSYGKLNIKKIDYGNPPMGIAYISSYLKKNNHSVKVIDLNLLKHPFKQIRRIIQKEKPKFAGISYMTPSLKQVKKIAQLVKDVDKNIKVVVGGPHPSALPKQTIRTNEIDFVICGEGEKTMLDLLEKRDYNKIGGLAYKKDKKIIINLPRQQINDLDSLPFPDYEGLKINKTYLRYGSAFFLHKVGIITSRGCPYKCTFCAEKIIHKKIRVRSVKNVVDEIECLYTKYGIERFEFYDELFTLYRNRAIKICKEIIKRKLNIKWIINSRVDNVDEELLKIMKSAGCHYIIYGIESGNQEILNKIKKEISISQIKNTIRTTKKVGLKTYGLFIMGFPYETDNTIRETINLAKELPLDYATFNLLIPLPGTEIFELTEKGQGIKFLSGNLDESKAVGYTNIELPTVSRKKLIEYQKRAYKEFYLRPRFLLNKLFFNPSFFIINFKKLSSFIRLIKS